MRIELTTSSLPRKCSTTEPQRQFTTPASFILIPTHQHNWSGRRGSNSPPIAWKAIALPNELLPHCFNPFLILKELFFMSHSSYCTIHEVQIYIKFCGQSRVRTYVLVREQIYSLSPLTTRPSALNEPEMGLEPATC
jgi:hypothetical protein